MNVETVPDAESLTLATLIHLARRVREARDQLELNFIAVNETHGLIPYRQAALWVWGQGIISISGVVLPEANIPYIQWLNRINQRFNHIHTSLEPYILTREIFSADEIAEWEEWFPASGLWLPLPGIDYRFWGGALLLVREDAWTTAETILLAEWAAIWSHEYALKAPISRFSRAWHQLFIPMPSHIRSSSTRSAFRYIGGGLRLRILLSVMFLVALFIPVHLTVLAPAELVPLHPIVIRAPLDGVIDSILVLPNQAVELNQPLLEFDRVNLQNRRQVAELELASVRSEYRQKAQQSFLDPTNKSHLAILQSKIAEREADVSYLQSLYQRGVVVAPRAGIVLFDDPTEWVGRPVVTGERIMVVADEHTAEIEAWLAPADAIPLAPGAQVTLFLNTNPLEPITGLLRYIAHEATLRPDNHYAYRVRASLMMEGPPPRIGLKGTAKLKGEEVRLGYWMIRRPWAALRTWLGW